MRKIILIAGHSRSGSTLLDRLLGEIAGFVTVGELRCLWIRGLLGDELCGCGTPFRSCGYWRDIVADLPAAETREAYARRVLRVQEVAEKSNAIPLLLNPSLRPREFSDRLDEYKHALRRLVSRIFEKTGARVIVDSSKKPAYALIMKELFGNDVHVVHLVRDSRAVAFSRLKTKLRPEVHWKKKNMAIGNPLRTGVEWRLANNILSAMYDAGRCTQLRYEDLVDRPRATIASLVAGVLAVNPATVQVAHIYAGMAELSMAHSVAGNPMRFATGKIPITLDDEWEKKLSGIRRRAVTLMTRKQLKQYNFI
ncbi:MAG: sulfotransferase [Proteobacteria bacterium]|nr:sulfotransferase [Pseudomonadota bacterium]